MTGSIAQELIDEAAALLRAGQLVAFPTETVYGLGADATNDEAVARIFAAKGRPRFNPLIVHFATIEAAAREVLFDARAGRLAEAFWPGPLTLVLPRRAGSRISRLCGAGLDTQAVRLPAHPVARRLITACERPIAAPSANASGRISPTTAAHVRRSLGGRVAMILDDGPCAVGLESTVVDLSGASVRLLRPGGITREAIEAVIGVVEETAGAGPLRAPGQLESHYAPRVPLRLRATDVAPDEALIAFGRNQPPGAKRNINLSATGDLVEAAGRLFAALHELDGEDVTGIAVVAIPNEGLGRAINDRLARAAAPRPKPEEEPA